MVAPSRLLLWPFGPANAHTIMEKATKQIRIHLKNVTSNWSL